MEWAIAPLVILAALIVGSLVDRRHKGSNRSPADIATGVERRWRLPGGESRRHRSTLPLRWSPLALRRI